MKAIWKYPLQTTDEQTIEVPENTQILTVQIQNEKPYLWCLVKTNNPQTPNTIKTYKIRTIGTGHPIENNFSGKYIGTYQLMDGSLVFHVFSQ